MKISITMKHPGGVLSPNGGQGWGWKASYAARKKLRKDAALAMLAAMGEKGLSEFAPRTYSIEWFYKGSVPDCDNIVARCKSIIDGACDAFGINDRILDIAGVRRVYAKWSCFCGCVVVVFDDGKEDKQCPNE